MDDVITHKRLRKISHKKWKDSLRNKDRVVDIT